VSRGGPKPGWYRDPTGRHDLRRWDGDGWSEWVMDASRRHFDDVDGCGGPPQGERVDVDGGGGRRVRAPRSSRPPRGARAPNPPAALPLAVPGVAVGRAFGWAMATVAVATAAALAIVAFAPPDVVSALLSRDPMTTLRRHAGPLVIAGAAFEAVLVAGFVLITRSSPRVRFRGISREEVLRGFITFLLALFAWTFFVGAIDGTSGRHWWPAAVGGLFLAEVVLTVVVAPVVEERVFRGFLLVGLRDRFGPVLGVLGQAAIYGAANAWALRDASRPGTVIGMAAVGAVFGWMAHTAGDLKPVMIGHAMFGAWVVAERVLGW
jgi:membrane protease YdiL (CAAX protease family)